MPMNKKLKVLFKSLVFNKNQIFSLFPGVKWLQIMQKSVGQVAWRQVLIKFHLFNFSEIVHILW